MLAESTIIYEYTNILLGKVNRDWFCNVFHGGTTAERRKAGGVVWRYAISNLLKWTPQMALLNLTPEIIHQLQLDRTLEQMDLHYTVKEGINLRQVLQYAFPDEISYNVETEAIDEYEKVMKLGVYKHCPDTRFRKNFFKGGDGLLRSTAILNYAISNLLGTLTPFELYGFFADKRKAQSWLSRQNIPKELTSTYEHPIDLIYYSQDSDGQNTIYYFNEKIAAELGMKYVNGSWKLI